MNVLREASPLAAFRRKPKEAKQVHQAEGTSFTSGASFGKRVTEGHSPSFGERRPRNASFQYAALDDGHRC